MSITVVLLGLISFSFVVLVCFLTASKRGLRVLMYHKLSVTINDKLTVNIDIFEKQLLYIKKHNYQPITLEQLKQYQVDGIKLPKKPVLITFDDGYENNFEHLYPLLKKHKLRSTIFLPVGFIGKFNAWDEGSETIMSFDRLKEMDSTFIEFGLHSFGHVNYGTLSDEELIRDIIESTTKLLENSIPFAPAIAYPYGAYPRDGNRCENFKNILKTNGILFGFRIGNKINKLPLTDPYLIKRIDIKGTDSFFEFRLKMLFGRIKLF